MTFYLPNDDIHPTGNEPLEFLGLPSMAERRAAGQVAVPPRPDRQETDRLQDVPRVAALDDAPGIVVITD